MREQPLLLHVALSYHDSTNAGGTREKVVCEPRTEAPLDEQSGDSVPPTIRPWSTGNTSIERRAIGTHQWHQQKHRPPGPR